LQYRKESNSNRTPIFYNGLSLHFNRKFKNQLAVTLQYDFSLQKGFKIIQLSVSLSALSVIRKIFDMTHMEANFLYFYVVAIKNLFMHFENVRFLILAHILSILQGKHSDTQNGHLKNKFNIDSSTVIFIG
jgi:hypothetical protein